MSSVVLALLAPNVNSQQFSTSTSLLTSSFTQPMTYYQPTVTVTSFTIETTEVDTISSGHWGNVPNICFFASTSLSLGSAPAQIEYSVSTPVTLEVWDEAAMGLWGIAYYIPSNMNQYACTPIGVGAFGLEYQTSLSGTGSFDLNPSQFPYQDTQGYGIVLTAPFASPTPPTATVSLGPCQLVLSVTENTSIPLISTIAGVTTLTSLSTLQLSVIQSYGDWIVGVVIVAVIAVIVLLLVNRRKRQSKRKPHRRKRG